MRRWVYLSDALLVPRQRTAAGRKSKIYALVDPRDAGVRYVGKTRKTLPARLAWHLREPTNAAMRAWFAELADLGLKPHAAVLEYVDDGEWEDAERGWIEWFRQRGKLLNVDLGGNHRDAAGRPRGRFVGKFIAPQSDAPQVGRGRDLWERMNRPMRPWQEFAGQNTRKGPVAGHGKRRYVTGDPGD